jgi:hypothetical protein
MSIWSEKEPAGCRGSSVAMKTNMKKFILSKRIIIIRLKYTRSYEDKYT